MLAENCIYAWSADTSKQRATKFDNQFPNCVCESHSLACGGNPVGDDELIARIFTTPYSYNNDARQIIWGKLVRAHTDGLSMFRSGCTEAQIRTFIKRVTEEAADEETLAGAALIPAKILRDCGNPDRWYCVYDTDSDDFHVHTDLIATACDPTLSKNKQGGVKEKRMKHLRDRLGENFVAGNTADALIAALRAKSFAIL